MPNLPRHSPYALPEPATPAQLDALLHELDIYPPGPVQYELVSEWAAKHVWRVDVGGEPWAYVRSLLGPADLFPERWRHLRLSVLLYEEGVGPEVLGLSEASRALGGRAVMVEAALRPIERDELEARAEEAIQLFARLHGSAAIRRELKAARTGEERERERPLRRHFREARERWFEAVVERWLAAGLGVINDLTEVVGDLFNRLEEVECCTEPVNRVVPTHNDPNAGNFMLDPQGELRLIDFENLALDNPVADLGLFLTWFVDPPRYADMLQHYPHASPEALLERMAVWVPLRYMEIAAHWAARLTRARTAQDWDFALKSVDEWLRGALEIVYGGVIPTRLDARLRAVTASLAGRGPLPPAEA